MKIFLLLLMSLLFLTGLTNIAEPDQSDFVSDEQFSNWITYYYRLPEPNRISQAIKYFCQSKLYTDKLILPMMSFFVAALKNKDAFLAKTYTEISQNGTTRDKTFFLNILWLINNDRSRSIIEKAKLEWLNSSVQEKIKQQSKSIPYDILRIPITLPQTLDMLWATFFATGEGKPVERIISVIPWSKDRRSNKFLIGTAAIWSLKSNARQHKKVLSICKNELKKQHGETKILLGEIIQSANQH